MKINLNGPDHTIFNSPGTEGSVEGADAQCYGKPISLPPSDSKEHTQHYGETMYSGSTPVLGGIMDGQEDNRPDGLGAYPLPTQGDQRHKSGGNNSDPTPAMPGA